jgi:glycosyltransferase involved in cell wall biosynthesis
MREAIRLRGEVRHFDPNLIHAHFGTVTGVFAAMMAGRRPVVITYRGGDLNVVPTADCPRASAGRILSQLAALGATRIVCVSRRLRDCLWWRRGITSVLPSGVDIDLFRPIPRAEARQRLGWEHDAPVILFNAGHDVVNKRLDLAEVAADFVRRRLPDVRMEILRGEIAPDLVPLFMNAADCLLVTSDSEGSPTIVQEAIATSLPIVSVDVGDVAERLRGISETRIVARRPDALSEALLDILQPPRRSNGREHATEISAARVAFELASLYRNTIADSPRKNLAWNTTLF